MKWILICFLCIVSVQAATLDASIESYSRGAYIKAFDGFYTLAKKGNAIAQHNVAIMYTMGKGVQADTAKAMQWYEKAAKQNYGLSAYNLGQLYQASGLQDIHAYTKAKYWYEKAIEGKVKEAYNNLATLYLQGYGVTKDVSKALELLESAAALDNSVAQVNVGRLYAWGDGITHDKMKAYENFKKALKAGESEASAYLDKLCQESAWVCKD